MFIEDYLKIRVLLWLIKEWLNQTRSKILEKYLESRASFFPNSIVVAVEGENFEQIDGNMGKLTLPNNGNIGLLMDNIDIGSAFSNTDKPISICAIEYRWNDSTKQFTSINSNQTKVSGDLIWDLKGELFRDLLIHQKPKKTKSCVVNTMCRMCGKQLIKIQIAHFPQE